MATLDRRTTKITQLRIAPKGDRSSLALIRLDKTTITLAAASNCAANTTTEITATLPVAFSTPAAPAATFDFVKVNPTAAIATGLGVCGAYISAAGTASLGNPLNPANTPTAATMKIRFVNATAGVLDAAGVYNVVLIRG